MPEPIARIRQLEKDLEAAQARIFELSMMGKPGSSQSPVSAEALAEAVAEFGRTLLVYMKAIR